MELYHILHISEALSQGDEKLAQLIADFLNKNTESLMAAVSHKNAGQMIEKIKENAEMTINQGAKDKKSSGTDIGKYLDFLNSLPTYSAASQAA